MTNAPEFSALNLAWLSQACLTMANRADNRSRAEWDALHEMCARAVEMHRGDADQVNRDDVVMRYAGRAA